MQRARFISLTAAATAGVPRIARAQTTPPIRFGTPIANDTAAQAFYAQELGYFRRAGLNVELTTFPSGATVAQAVAGNALDVGLTNVIGLATAIARGIPFGLLAGAGMYSSAAPTTVLAALKSAPFKSASDLEGKIVSVPALRDMTYAAASSWLASNGADVSKIKFVEIPFPEARAALERGTVAAAMIAEPSMSIALRGPVRVFGKAFDAIAHDFMVTAIFANTDWLHKNPDTAKKLAQVLYDTARWANANRAQSGQILATYAKMDPEVLKTMTRCNYATNADPALIQPALDMGFKFKLLDRAMTASELIAKA